MKKIRIVILFILLGLSLSFTSVRAGHGESIDSLIKIEIGGVPQSILVRGQNIDNPVLLRLHGGPGYPFFPYLPQTGPQKDLEKYYTMIYWEQRGTGASFSKKIKKQSMNTQQFVDDAYEVLQFSKNLLHKEKVYVWGHSWGSNIGILLSHQHPEDIIAYIGTGQSANTLANERSCYRFALVSTQKEHNEKGIKSLSKIDTNNYELKDALEVRKWIFSYGGVVFSSGEERGYVDDKIIKKIWHTPEYTLRDKMNIVMHPYYSGRHLWNDMKLMNFFEDVPSIQVPVFFLLGAHDIIVSSEIASNYFNQLNAQNGKTLIWFEDSAHRPFQEEPEKFLDVMINRVLKDTMEKNRP